MSSSWAERHGQVGDLSSKSKEELFEILSRQEKLLHNKRFISTLPDKGRKISDFAERVRLALAHRNEGEKKTNVSLSSGRTEPQAEHQRAFAQSRHVTLIPSVLDIARPTLNEDSLESAPTNTVYMGSSSYVDGPHGCGSLAEKRSKPTTVSRGDLVALSTTERANDNELVEAFERVKLSEGKFSLNEGTAINTSPRNPFSVTQLHKKPHYMEILDISDTCVRDPRFKPNKLLEKPSSPGSVPPLTAVARRQRDRKHLDDITAARLPPVYHGPAQLLSLEESVDLLQEQTKKYQELHAKLAAQKLAEGLTVGVSNYNPEGGALAAYREVHDDGALAEEE